MIDYYSNESRLTEIIAAALAGNGSAEFIEKFGAARTREEIFVSRALGVKAWDAVPPWTTMEAWLAYVAGDRETQPDGRFIARTAAESATINYICRLLGDNPDGYAPVFPPHTPYEIALARLAGIVPLDYGVIGSRWEALLREMAVYKGARKDVVVIDGGDGVSRETTSGDPAIFENGTGCLLMGLSAGIEPQQDFNGYSHPWPAGGGKNQLPNYPAGDVTKNGITYHVEDDGVIYATGTSGSSAWGAQLNLWTGDGGDIAGKILSGCPAGGGSSTWRIIVQLAASPYTTYATDSGNGVVIPDTVAGVTVNVVAQVRGGGVTVNNLRFAPMIRAAGTDAAFTPYSNICPITGWDSINIHVSPDRQTEGAVYQITIPTAAGTVYGGTLDALRGVLTVDRAIIKMTGTESWNHAVLVGLHTFNMSLPDAPMPTIDKIGGYAGICDTFPVDTYDWVPSDSTPLADNTARISAYRLTSSRPSVLVVKNDISTSDDFKTWLTEHNVSLVYPLAVPLTYTLDPTDIELLVGSNVVWSEAGPVSIVRGCPADNAHYLGVGCWKLTGSEPVELHITVDVDTETGLFDLAASNSDWQFSTAISGVGTVAGAGGSITVSQGTYSVVITATPATGVCYIQPTLYNEGAGL